MNPTEARLQALQLAVATQGNPNKVVMAREYLAFLREDETPVQTPRTVTPSEKAVPPKSLPSNKVKA